ncbi:MAG: hypothetical protein JWL76_967 [Thermoleophilia bacterium]|nr:hypothetical protein [Thermoleophilia bacterium]
MCVEFTLPGGEKSTPIPRAEIYHRNATRSRAHAKNRWDSARQAGARASNGDSQMTAIAQRPHYGTAMLAGAATTVGLSALAHSRTGQMSSFRGAVVPGILVGGMAAGSAVMLANAAGGSLLAQGLTAGAFAGAGALLMSSRGSGGALQGALMLGGGAVAGLVVNRLLD